MKALTIHGMVVSLGMLLWLQAAQADIYKCDGPNGVSYSDRPCRSAAGVTKQPPPSPASTDLISGNELMRKCKAGDTQACQASSRVGVVDYGSIEGAKKIEPAQPVQFLRQVESSCVNGQRATFFALHSAKIERILLAESEARKAEIFKMYCTMWRETQAKLPGGDPAAAVYMIKEMPVGTKGRKQSVLCIIPDSDTPRCDIGFDVIFEDGVLKKDEL